MPRRLLGYALLADGLMVALFDGGYVRIWNMRPLPGRLVDVSKRASGRPFLTRLLGVAEITAGAAIIALTMVQQKRATDAELRKLHRPEQKKAA